MNEKEFPIGANIIYEILDPVTGKKYIGSKMNWKGPGTYFGSSGHPEMIEIKKTRKLDLIFNILEIVETQKDLIDRELYYQKRFKVVESEDYWNIKYVNKWNSYMIGRSHSEETKEKMRIGNLNKIMPQSAIETLKIKNKKVWDDKKESGENYFSDIGMSKLVEEGKKVGKLPRDAEWSRKHRERRLGSTNKRESKDKTSKTLAEKYEKGEIRNGMAKKVFFIPIEGDPIEYPNRKLAAKTIGKQSYHITQAIRGGKIMCGGYWRDSLN